MLRYVVFFLVMLLVFGGVNFHVLRRVSRTFALTPRARLAVAVAAWGSFAGTLLGRAGESVFDVSFGVFTMVSAALQLVVILAFALLLPLDVLALVRWARRRFQRPIVPPPAAGEQAPPAPTRREFIEQVAVGGSLLVAGSSSLYGVLAGRHDYQLEEVAVKVPGLKPTLDGFTIVQLSDVHIGKMVGRPELAAAWELVQRAAPDLVVLTGDLLDHDARLAGELGHFARRLGEFAPVVAVTGNHDFYAGVDPTCQALQAAGTRVLRNDGIVVGDAGGSFALLGVDDVMGPRIAQGPGADLATARKRLPQSDDMPRLLLCHNPSYFAAAAGQVDVQLSGHTHGGQIRLGISPADLFLWHGWVRGRYEHRNSQLYVNRGFGTVGPPARIGAPPEVTRLVLHS